MTLALMLRAKAEGVPLPAAMAPGTPWSDLTETGDSYKTNEWLDNVLVSYSGYLGPRRPALCQRPRPARPAALADLRRLPRPAAGDPDHGDARPVPEQHGPHAPQAARCGGGGGAAGVRGLLPRAVSVRRERAGDEGRVRRDHRVLRPAPGEITGPAIAWARPWRLDRAAGPVGRDGGCAVSPPLSLASSLSSSPAPFNRAAPHRSTRPPAPAPKPAPARRRPRPRPAQPPTQQPTRPGARLRTTGHGGAAAATAAPKPAAPAPPPLPRHLRRKRPRRAATPACRCRASPRSRRTR